MEPLTSKINVLDHGYVAAVTHWGGDESIIEAARMSTSGGFKGWGPYHESTCNISIALDMNKDLCKCNCVPKAGDEKLLAFLWNHSHLTPFEMAGLTVEVQAPIFIFREWHRHRTQSYNELSARYTELPDLFYIPSLDRISKGGQSKSNKQGSGEAITNPITIHEVIVDSCTAARNDYEWLLKQGVSRELARLVIPVNQYSRMRASANLRNWLAFLKLRLGAGAQWEIRQYAEAVAQLVEERFPRTFSLFKQGLEGDSKNG